MTYGQLDRESSKLAGRLQEFSSGAQSCVGILFDRSKEFVVAALAVLKSGAGYLPFDSSTPADRLGFILKDAGAAALVTGSRVTKHLPMGSWSTIIVDSGETEVVTPHIAREAPPDALAYVVYTSGSTGRPKGVEITHRNLRNLIQWHQSTFAVTATDRASQVAGLGFDAAGWEIWPYLTAGASVHIADDETRRSPQDLCDWIVSKKITISFVPTILAEQLFYVDWPQESAMRILLTGGDTLGRRPPAGLRFSVINNYGPTECTVVATSGRVPVEDGTSERPSIGRPISDSTAHILDQYLQPVPPGSPGELCMGGELVARGYRNAPGLTASRFVTYTTASGESLRIYRTGDQVRLLENGEIAFLGRLDDQIKIRGYRIEPREIVACFNDCPGVAASAVTVRDNGQSLVAYVVPAADADLTDSAMREYLATKLADYMIPALFVRIPALPLSANGKLDATALPDPATADLLHDVPEAQESHQNDLLRQQVGAMVASLLKRPAVDLEENFFMAGGHSMLGVQLVARIREEFGVRLTLRQLFQSSTVAALSDEVARLTSQH